MANTLRFLGFFSPWLVFFWALHYTWDGGTYYRYGWFVPIATIMIWRRHTPFLPPPRQKATKDILSFLVILLALGALLVLRIIERTDPGWRAPLLLHGFIITASAAGIVALQYGRKSTLRWIPLLAFPLTALPLPSPIEQFFVGELTQIVLKSSAYAMNFLGHPVEVSGNLLFGDGRTISIDDACSGIRSLQALLMLTCFFALWFHIRRYRLIGLLIAPILLCIVINTLRAIALSYIALRYGEAFYDAWHDSLGLIAFSTSIIALYGYSAWLGDDSLWLRPKRAPSTLNALPRTGLILTCSLVLLSEVLAYTHFRTNVERNAILFPWTFRFEQSAENEFIAPLPLEAIGLAHFGGDTTETATFHLPENRTIDIGYIAFNPGNPRAWFGIYGHSLVGCMGTRASEYLGDGESKTITIHGTTLPLTSQAFRRRGSKEVIYAFRLTGLEDSQASNGNAYRLKRLSMALRGNHQQAYQAILAGCLGFTNEQEALASVESILNRSAIPKRRD